MREKKDLKGKQERVQYENPSGGKSDIHMSLAESRHWTTAL